MREPFARVAIAFCCSITTACGGGGTTTPSAPSPTTAPNRSPSITGVTIAPAFGISQLTQFTMTATGTDPDGDGLTFLWDFGDGTTGSGASVTKMYQSQGDMTVRASLSDGKSALVGPHAATVSESRQLAVGGMSGRWIGRRDCGGLGNGDFQLDLVQMGSSVTGTMLYLSECGRSPQGTNARTDPAQVGRIDATGSIELRIKVLDWEDYTLRGQMDQTGQRVTGGVFGSGWSGQEFTMERR